MSLFSKVLANTLHHEGLWSDHRDDPGGATMKGVTLKTYSDFLGRPATKDELRKIPDDHLLAIYRKGYWDKVKGDELAAISPGLAVCVFDFAVNSGPGRAAYEGPAPGVARQAWTTTGNYNFGIGGNGGYPIDQVGSKTGGGEVDGLIVIEWVG